MGRYVVRIVSEKKKYAFDRTVMRSRAVDVKEGQEIEMNIDLPQDWFRQ